MAELFLFANAVLLPGYLVCLAIPFSAFVCFGIYRIVVGAVQRRKEKLA